MLMLPTFHFNIERWKYNPTFELYVSNMGHIRNKSKTPIAPKVKQSGYLAVYVYGSLNKYMSLHRVVMLTWRPTPEAEFLTVDHIDHNKRNNALSNLEWVTKEENGRRASEDHMTSGFEVDVDDIAAGCPCPCHNGCGGMNVTSRAQSTSTSNFNALPQWDNKVKAVAIAVHCNSTNENFQLLPDIRELDEKFGKYFGIIQHLTRNGINNIIKDLLSGKNSCGYKKYCGFTLRVEK